MATRSKSARDSWRKRRVAHLAAQVAAGEYSVPAIDVAHAIMFGRPKWGDDPRIALSILDEGIEGRPARRRRP